MNKRMKIAIAIAISTFLSVNLYLLFSNKSVISKSVYVSHYERMTSSDHRKEIIKKGLVAPAEMHTVYVGNEDIVDSWLVKEGDLVTVGDEIAILQTEQAEGQRALWEAEFEALYEQQFAVQNLMSDIDAQWGQAKSNGTTTINQKDNEAGWNVQVDVNQDASYAQAIAAAEQELADIDRQLVVLEVQLAQNPSRPALISPVEGVVSKVTRLGSALSVDIYSTQRVMLTYAQDDEWKEIVSGNRVYLQEEGVKKAAKGTVEIISTAPAITSEWLSAYKKLDDTEVKNPLAYYEVRISTDSNLQTMPFGMNLKAVIVVDEALEVVSVQEEWLVDSHEKTAKAWMIDAEGRATTTDIVTPFTVEKRVVVTEGLQLGDVVFYKPMLETYGEDPKIFLPLPTDLPEKAEWRAFGWKNYMKYMLVK